MSINQLLTAVKAAGEDFEWYPTTFEIIQALRDDILAQMKSGYNYPTVSIMDVGAGNGKVLSALKEMERRDVAEANKENRQAETLSISQMYAIEKSQTLINAMPDDIYILGSEFWQQTFVDKKVDILFSNPPFLEQNLWAEKLIKEAHARYVYLVLPDRWEKDERIALALEKREATAEVVGAFSFENAEDRKARTNVHLLRIHLAEKYNNHHSKNLKVDPFELWFNETYNFDAADVKEKSEYEAKEEKRTEIRGSIVKGSNLIERLEELYLKDMSHLHKNYLSIASLDVELLQQMGISKNSMMEAMKQKIEGLKHLYWEELFSNLDTITSRLTSKSRTMMLEKLRGNTSVDFTVQNSYSIVIWAIKNANKYYNEQLIALYKDLTRTENIRMYKSNTRVVYDDWRYLKEEMSHYALDYRIIMHFHGLIDSEYFISRVNGLSEYAVTMINDIITVANNLGFSLEDESRPEDSSMRWESQVKNNFYLKSSPERELKKGTKTNLGRIEDTAYLEEDGVWQYFIDGYWRHWSHVKTEEDIFVEIKAFKNGNIHCKFNKKFMKSMNVNVAKLLNWVKSPKEASEEFDITLKEATEMFGSNFTLLPSSMSNLLPNSQIEQEAIDEASDSFAKGTLF